MLDEMKKVFNAYGINLEPSRQVCESLAAELDHVGPLLAEAAANGDWDAVEHLLSRLDRLMQKGSGPELTEA